MLGTAEWSLFWVGLAVTSAAPTAGTSTTGDHRGRLPDPSAPRTVDAALSRTETATVHRAAPEAVHRDDTGPRSGRTVYVRAPRTPAAPVADPSAAVYEVPPEALRRGDALGRAVTDLAEAAAGLRVEDLGTAGLRRVQIRGGSSAQVAVVWNGIPLRSPFATGTTLDFVDPGAIQRLRVIRGGAALSAGEGALTGAVLLDTESATVAEHTAGLTAGSFGSVRSRVGFRDPSTTIAVGFDRSDGDFRYRIEDLGLPPREAVRRNNAGHKGQLWLARRWKHMQLDAGIVARRQQLPGPENLVTQSEERRARVLLRLSGQHRLGANQLGWAAHGHLLDLDFRERSQSPIARLRTHFFAGGGDLRWARALGGHHLSEAQFSGSLETARSLALGRRTRFVGEATLRHRIFGGPWTGIAGMGVPTIGGLGTILTPRVGLSRRIGDWLLRLGAGRSTRAPRLDELYHPNQGGLEGNPALRWERAWEAQFGLARQRGALRFDVDLFARRARDTIAYVRRNAFVVTPVNLPGTRTYGADGALTWAPRLPGLRPSLRLRGAWLWARQRPSGDRVPGQPQWQLAPELAVTLLRPDLYVQTEWIFFGESYASRLATPDQRVAGYARWDAQLTWSPAAEWTLGAVVQNLLDRRNLSSVHKYPLPGRAIFVSLHFRRIGTAPP